MTQRIGLFGGSFDPVHIGHIASANELVDVLQLDNILMLPCAQHALQKVSAAAPQHRRAMLALAIKQSPHLSLDDRELQRQGITYSIDTCRELRAEYGADAVLCFIVGSDVLDSLHLWREWKQLLDIVNLVIMQRAVCSDDEVSQPSPVAISDEVASVLDNAVKTIRQPFGELIRVACTPYPVASSRIRPMLAERAHQKGDECQREPGVELEQNLRNMLPAQVLDYIDENGLYADAC